MRCAFEWPSGPNFQSPHICRLEKGHEGSHECVCGYSPGDADQRTADADRPIEACPECKGIMGHVVGCSQMDVAR
jgi:hypothetical protein